MNHVGRRHAVAQTLHAVASSEGVLRDLISTHLGTTVESLDPNGHLRAAVRTLAATALKTPGFVIDLVIPTRPDVAVRVTNDGLDVGIHLVNTGAPFPTAATAATRRGDA